MKSQFKKRIAHLATLHIGIYSYVISLKITAFVTKIKNKHDELVMLFPLHPFRISSLRKHYPITVDFVEFQNEIIL